MSWDIEYLKKQLLFFEQNRNFPKRRWVRSRNVFLSSARLDSLIVNKKLFWELAEVSLHETTIVFCSNAKSRFGCAIFRTRRSVPWLFTSCVWDVLRYRILRKKQLLIFSETWSSSFWIVCNWFDDFRPNFPKFVGQFHRKENTNFPKWRWVRSKIVCLSSGLFFSLVVTKKHVLRISWGLPTWKNTCFCSNAESRFGCAIFRTLR